MAPFKLRFLKMSKSRSNGSKESQSSSVDCDESAQHLQQYQPNNSNVQALASCSSRPETPGNENATGFPDSPPPSYQHVLEETRLKRSTTNPEENVEEEDETEEKLAEERRVNEQRKENVAEDRNDQRRNKTDEMQRSSGGGGSGPDGSGGGGGNGGSGGGSRRTPAKGPEILHKSSKELYRAVAKQWGITCKMSDQCRCFDCQSHYFDCEYEKDEQGKTDGGLGAGSPMFIAEVIHGTACVLL